MERELNFRRLLKMYVLNSWVILFTAVICAVLIGVFLRRQTKKLILNKCI